MLAHVAIIVAHLAHPAPNREAFALRLSEVCIRGDQLAAVEPLFKRLAYRIVGPVLKVDSTKAATLLSEAMPNNHRVRKAAYVSNGWTHIFDPELVIWLDDGGLKKLSKSLDASIVTWICESSSRTYGFTVHSKGVLLRQVLSLDGHLESEGRRLPAEDQSDWKKASEAEVMKVVKRLGPAYLGLTSGIEYRIYDLDEGG